MSWTRTIAVILALVVAGCRRPANPPVGPAEPPSHTRHVLLQGGFLELRITAPDAPAGPKPAVISYVEEFRGSLLETGVVIVSYALHWELLRGLAKPPSADAPPPPHPVGKWLLASPSPQVIGQGYLGLIDGTARGTIADVLDALATDPDVDPTHLGIVGFSTNGFIALQATAANPRLRVAVAIAACGDYHRFLHESTLAMNGEPLDLAPDYDRWLRERELARHPLRVVHAAVLMVNGRTDLPVPISCAETTVRTLRRAYAEVGASDRFRFVVVDDGHVMGGQARREAMAWLERWLVR